MMDLFDDDLFAVRPASPDRLMKATRDLWDAQQADFPAFNRQAFEDGTELAQLATMARASATLEPYGPRYPVASFSCACCARDEVREPAPERLNCWSCRMVGGMTRWLPPAPPPPDAGRRV